MIPLAAFLTTMCKVLLLSLLITASNAEYDEVIDYWYSNDDGVFTDNIELLNGFKAANLSSIRTWSRDPYRDFYDPEQCKNGPSYKIDNGCNTCTCLTDNMYMCTLKKCYYRNDHEYEPVQNRGTGKSKQLSKGGGKGGKIGKGKKPHQGKGKKGKGNWVPKGKECDPYTWVTVKMPKSNDDKNCKNCICMTDDTAVCFKNRCYDPIKTSIAQCPGGKHTLFVDPRQPCSICSCVKKGYPRCVADPVCQQYKKKYEDSVKNPIQKLSSSSSCNKAQCVAKCYNRHSKLGDCHGNRCKCF